MIDIKQVRENSEIYLKDLEKRKVPDKIKWLKDLVKLDQKWRQVKFDLQKVVHLKKEISMEISEMKKKEEDITLKLKRLRQIPETIEVYEAEMDKMEEKINYYLMRLPNLLHESVPQGDSEEDNEVVNLYGKKPTFDFEPKSHVDLLKELDIADIERAGKISGSRFWFLKGTLAELDLALQKYAVDFMTKRGYILIHPPFMMNREAYEGVTDLSDFENVMYKIDGEDLYLIATSEHPLTAMFYNEIMDEKQFPIKMVGISTCFRKEAGSHGKDTKGIFRGHQFNKIEQVIICKPEESWTFHEELIKNMSDFFESLNLHFRQVNICTGDIGTVAAKKYDLEVWMPVQKTYREVGSCSNCTDYQARRLKMRYKTNKDTIIPHTLNSTCVATSRALVAILENYQQKEGSIKIPNVLVPYMNGKLMIKKV
ncbi:serine--tRNA ligase [Candidatus Woesearchaeota archaeon]|nr:serine--tRNA ligase [Candidatus Woesearchaeota archaeon]